MEGDAEVPHGLGLSPSEADPPCGRDRPLEPLCRLREAAERPQDGTQAAHRDRLVACVSVLAGESKAPLDLRPGLVEFAGRDKHLGEATACDHLATPVAA